MHKGRPPRSSTLRAALQTLVRHYRACELTDERIAKITDISLELIDTVQGANLLTPEELEELRTRPGVP